MHPIVVAVGARALFAFYVDIVFRQMLMLPLNNSLSLLIETAVVDLF
jgi:hypothetical protein